MKTQKTKNGFTLIEVIIALFIFILIMSSSAIFFSNLFKNYGDARDVQENIENAQYAMNLMAKTFRTSSVAIDGSPSYVQVLDYSQNDTCIRYSFSVSGLMKTIGSSGTDLSTCEGDDLSGGGDLMTDGEVSGYFDIVKSDGTPGSKQVGKITTSMTITKGISNVNLQTTSSLRDYVESGISL